MAALVCGDVNDSGGPQGQKRGAVPLTALSMR